MKPQEIQSLRQQLREEVAQVNKEAEGVEETQKTKKVIALLALELHKAIEKAIEKPDLTYSDISRRIACLGRRIDEFMKRNVDLKVLEKELTGIDKESGDDTVSIAEDETVVIAEDETPDGRPSKSELKRRRFKQANAERDERAQAQTHFRTVRELEAHVIAFLEKKKAGAECPAMQEVIQRVAFAEGSGNLEVSLVKYVLTQAEKKAAKYSDQNEGKNKKNKKVYV